MKEIFIMMETIFWIFLLILKKLGYNHQIQALFQSRPCVKQSLVRKGKAWGLSPHIPNVCFLGPVPPIPETWGNIAFISEAIILCKKLIYINAFLCAITKTPNATTEAKLLSIGNEKMTINSPKIFRYLCTTLLHTTQKLY